MSNLFGTDANQIPTNGMLGNLAFQDKAYVSVDKVGIGSTFVDSGTSNQNLQVSGGAYISDSVGIGTTTPGGSLHITPTSTSIAGLFSGSTSSDMLRITQLGSGNAIVVEDSTNPDATPFVVGAAGSVGVGTNNPTQELDVNGDVRLRAGLYDFNNSAGTSGQSLISTGAGVSWTTATGITSVREVLLTSGSTYTPPTDAKYFMVYCTGGGGGGGNAAGTDTSNANGGAGGGAGGTAIYIYNPTEMGSSATYSIGSGGAGGSTAGATGGTGGTTSFNPDGTGPTLTGNGGLGGTGNSSANNNTYSNGGTGGTATGGDINAKGQSGFSVTTAGANAVGGNGGASYYGGGGEGAFTIAVEALAGGSASTIGAGGGGAATRNLSNASTDGVAGGNGSAGAIFIIEYI